MTGIELVVTDLDGTLWENPDDTPPENVAAVKSVMGNTVTGSGIPVLVATGRRTMSTRTPLFRLGLRPPAVVLNGGIGLDLESGDRFHVGGFTSVQAMEVLEVFLGLGLQPCVYVDSDEPSVRVGKQPSTHPRHLASFGPNVATADLRQVAETETVLSFSVLGLDQTVCDELHDLLLPVAVPHNSADRIYGGHTVTVAPTGVSKWEGIVSFCSAHRIDPGRVLVVGDGPNDVEMLSAAAVAVVPSDGHPDALAVADHVIPPAGEGGWAQVPGLVQQPTGGPNL